MAIGRIRTIKPELLHDEVIAKLPHDLWRLFISLKLLADDDGNFRAVGPYVGGQCFWAAGEEDTFDPLPTEELLVKLAKKNLIILYTVRGQKYGHIRGWDKHEYIAPSRRTPPKVPGINDPDAMVVVHHEDQKNYGRTSSRMRAQVESSEETDRLETNLGPHRIDEPDDCAQKKFFGSSDRMSGSGSGSGKGKRSSGAAVAGASAAAPQDAISAAKIVGHDPADNRYPPRNIKELTCALLEYLNKHAKRRYEATHPSAVQQRFIAGRVAEGAVESDFRKIIWHKTNEWRDDPKMAKYLRVQTLFAPSHFEDYLEESQRAYEQEFGPESSGGPQGPPSPPVRTARVIPIGSSGGTPAGALVKQLVGRMEIVEDEEDDNDA